MLKEKIENLLILSMNLIQYQICFSRSLFCKTDTKLKFNENEQKFLFIFFDCMANVPDLLRNLYQFNKNNEVKINTGLLDIVERDMFLALSLLTSKERRFNCGIKDTGMIKKWKKWIRHLNGSDKFIEDDSNLFKTWIGHLNRNKIFIEDIKDHIHDIKVILNSQATNLNENGEEA